MADVDRLVEQARQMLAVGAIEVRYGREYDATILAGLADAVEQLQTWDGLMSLLDEHYPSDVFVGGESSDPGPRIVGLVRELDAERARVAALEAGIRKLGVRCAWVRSTGHRCKVGVCPDCELWALLDGRVPSTGQETT